MTPTRAYDLRNWWHVIRNEIAHVGGGSEGIEERSTAMSAMGRRSVLLRTVLMILASFSVVLLGTPNPVWAQKGGTTPTRKRLVVYFHFAPDGCENCRGLAPDIERFYEEHGSEYDVRGVVITHWGRHDAAAVRNFVRTAGIKFPIVGFNSLASTESPNPGFVLVQGTRRKRRPSSEYVPPAVRNANTRQHPVVQVYDPHTQVTRVASVGNVEYTSMVERIEVVSSGGTGPVLRGST